MPEGDAVVRAARRIDAALGGRRLERAELRWPTVGGVDLTGRILLGTATVGKHLLTRFDDGRTLHTHLRMDGSWRIVPAQPPRRFGPDVRAVLADAHQAAVGRLLGMMDVLLTVDERRLLAHLGPDVLAPEWDREGAAANLRSQGARAVGESLLDQRVVAGLGTIFMAESLWAHRIWPWTPSSDVADPEALLDTARALMQTSVGARTFTATGDTRPGRQTNVYGRPGRPCPRCGAPVGRGEVGAAPQSRPAFYCPGCQQRPSVG